MLTKFVLIIQDVKLWLSQQLLVWQYMFYAGKIT